MSTLSDEEDVIMANSKSIQGNVELNEDEAYRNAQGKSKKAVAKVVGLNGEKDEEGNNMYTVKLWKKRRKNMTGDNQFITKVMNEEEIRSYVLGDCAMEIFERERALEELLDKLTKEGKKKEIFLLFPASYIAATRKRRESTVVVAKGGRGRHRREGTVVVAKEEGRRQREEEEEEEEDSQISESSSRRQKKKWNHRVDDFIVPDGVIDPPSRSRHRDQSMSSTMSEPKRRGRPPKVNKGTPSKDGKKIEKKNRTPPKKSKRADESEDGESDDIIQFFQHESPKKDNGTKSVRKNKMIESDESGTELDEPSSRGRRAVREKDRGNDKKKEKDAKKVVEKRRGRSAMLEKEKETDKKRDQKNRKKEKEQSDEESDEDEVSAKRARMTPVTRGSSTRKKKPSVTVDDLFESEDEEEEEEEEEDVGRTKKLEAKKRKVSEGKKKERKSKRRSLSSEESEECDEDGEGDESEEEEEESEEIPSCSTEKKKRGRPKKKLDKGDGRIKTAQEIHKEKAKASKARKKKAEEKKAKEAVMEKLKAKNYAIMEHVRGKGVLPTPAEGADLNDTVHHADADLLYVSREGNRSPRCGSPVPMIREGSRSPSRSPYRSREGSPDRGEEVFDQRAHASQVGGKLQELKDLGEAREDWVQKMKDDAKKEIELRRKREMKKMRKVNSNTPIDPNEIRIKPKVAIHGPRDVGIISAASPAPSSIGSSTSRPTSSLGMRGGVSGRGGRGAMRKTSQMSTPGVLSGVSILDSITGEMDRSLPTAPSVTRTNNDAPSGSAVRTYIPAGRGVRPEILNRPMDYGRRNDIVHIDSPLGVGGRPSSSSYSRPRPSSQWTVPSHPPPPSHQFEQVTLSDSPPFDDQYGMMDDDIHTAASPLPMEEAEEAPSDDRLYEDRVQFYEDNDELPTMDRLEEVLHMRGSSEEDKERMMKRTLLYMEERLKEGASNEILWALYHKQKTSDNKKSFFDRLVNRLVIFNLIERIESPSYQLRSALVQVDRWDRMFRDWRKRYGQCHFTEEEVHRDAPLSFVVLAKVTGERGRITEKISPLSVAVEENRLEWAEFLLQMGANVNEKIVMANLEGQPFTGYTIQLAIEKMATPRVNLEARLDMIELLLKYGANREVAIATLESMKEETIRRDGLSEEAFKRIVPSYSRYYELVNSACASSHIALTNSVLNSTHDMFTRVFDVVNVYEKVCTRPYEKFLNMQVFTHVRRWENDPENCPVFAVVVGYSEENVLMEYKEPGSYKRESKKEIIQIHHNRVNESPFTLTPLVISPPEAPEPAMNKIPFKSISDQCSIFVIPPHILHRLEAVLIWVDDHIITPKQMVFGGLLQLRFKDGIHSVERVKEELGHLRGTGDQFEGLLEKKSGDEVRKD